ncbi:MAG: alpha/beta hydrolase [Aeromicrobium sp.]
MFGTPSNVAIGDLSFDVWTAGPADGEAVLLLHGFPQSAAGWSLVAPHIVDAGHRVIIPNQRGYSSGARPVEVAAYGTDELVGDIVGLLDALELGSVHLVGHDWGAAVSWPFAVSHPHRVRSLTAVSVPHLAAYGRALREDSDQQQRASYIGLLRQPGKAESLLLENDAQRLRAMYQDAVPAEQADEHLRILTEPGALTAALNWYRAMTADLGDLPPVKVPTTYVWSDQDTAIGRAGALRCGDYVDAPYEFIELSGTSHWIPEQAPEVLSNAILARIASV